VALVANAKIDKLTSSSTFRSRLDWSEPHNLGINFPVIRHFSSSLQNAYSSEELNGLLYGTIIGIIRVLSKFNFLSASGGPWTPLRALPPCPRYRLALRARHVVPHCLQEIAATAPHYPPTVIHSIAALYHSTYILRRVQPIR